MSTRIVHDIDHLPSVSGGGTLYATPVGEEKSSGFRASLFLSTEGSEPEPAHVYIEGDAAYLLHALRELVDSLETCAKLWVDKGQMDPDWYDKAMKADAARRGG